MSEFTRCNYCTLNALSEQYDKLILLPDQGWIEVYELDAVPTSDQRIPDYQGRPVRWHASFMALTDHCVC